MLIIGMQPSCLEPLTTYLEPDFSSTCAGDLLYFTLPSWDIGEWVGGGAGERTPSGMESFPVCAKKHQVQPIWWSSVALLNHAWWMLYFAMWLLVFPAMCAQELKDGSYGQIPSILTLRGNWKIHHRRNPQILRIDKTPFFAPYGWGLMLFLQTISVLSHHHEIDTWEDETKTRVQFSQTFFLIYFVTQISQTSP